MDKYDTLLLACGTKADRQQIRSVLGQRYNLLEAANTQQTMLLLKQNVSCIAAVLLNITEPSAIDRKVIGCKENADFLRQVPVIIITKDDNDPDVLNACFSRGAADVIPIDYEPYAMLHRVQNIVQLSLHKRHLESMVAEQTDALRNSSNTMVDALSAIIEHRSVESGQHILRIRRFTKILLEEVARACPEYRLDDTAISIISSASALHDIGKIAIPDSILMKPGPLTQEEREIMKTHAITGCRILDTLSDMGDPEYVRQAYNICHYHHERWDGSGYPEGLFGEAIPIGAQVVGLADVYDALTSKRVYKEAFSFDRAVNMILKGECGAFSPKLLECFKHVTDAYEALALAYADGMSPKNETFDTSLPAPDVEQETDTMERVRAKYFALVHYINGMLMEVDLDRGLFHLVYNPYPEMAWLEESTTLQDITRMLGDQVIASDDREEMLQFFYTELPRFVGDDLRRMTRHFRFRSKQHPQGDHFEVTLLRINPIDASRRTLAVLCRRIPEDVVRLQRDEPEPVPEGSTFVCRNDEQFTLVRFGKHIPQVAGYTQQELEDQFDGKMLQLLVPEDRDLARRQFRERLRHGTKAEAEFRLRHKDGSVIWILSKCYLVLGSDGTEYLYNFVTDITHTRRDYESLQEKLRRYEIILAQTENVLFEWDCVEDTISFSDTWKPIFGFQPQTQNVHAFLVEGTRIHPDDIPRLLDRVTDLENGSPYEMEEVRIANARGYYIWCRFRATALRGSDGKLEKISGIIINIDVEKQTERMLQDRAERDSLTKLLNKNAVRKHAEEYLGRFPNGTNCALLIIDLDNFKQVNDQYGHLFGDAVLTKVAREIEKLFRDQDLVGRIGGDEFLVLMRGVSQRNLLENRCRRLLGAIQTIFHNKHHKLPLGCSIGIALSPEHGTSYFELFERADQALYRAKARGKNGFVFYDEMDTSPARMAKGSALNNHIDSDEEPGLAEDNLVRYAFQHLYAAMDPQQSIQDILSYIGKKMNVSRVYVFENTDDNRHCQNTYEWCNEGIEPEIHNLQNISYETDIPHYEDNFDEQGIFYCPDISVLAPATYDIVYAQGIKSMLQCAIRERGVFRGYIGFDECREQRFWTKEQIHLLSYFSEMLSVFLLRYRKQEKLRRQAEEMKSVLDSQNNWIYIVDPDTCELKYLNAPTRENAPGAEPGMLCYKALAGKTERCRNCLARNIRREKNISDTVKNRGAEVSVDAALIRWEGEEACLMSCRRIPEEKKKDFPEPAAQV